MTIREGARIENREPYGPDDSDRTAGATYRELFQIGKGGFSTISVALAQGIEGFSKLVVLKTLREELSTEPGAARMFMDEARLSARLNHPNIVQVYEVFRRGQAAIIAMEYVDGQPLSGILAQGRNFSPMSLDLGIAILIQILSALHHVHTLCDFSGEPLGLIHRDVSPHNVMVAYDGQVKLVDFGIAKFANAEQTSAGVIKGKIAYMSPEQFIGDMDHRADIFAVGVMLWELATGQRYWAGLPEPMIMRQLLKGDLPHLRQETDMDPELLAICCRALSPSLEHRYASAAEMQEDLERYLTQRGVVVNQAAIGQYVAKTCADIRDKVQSAIRSQLSQIGMTSIRQSESRRVPTINALVGAETDTVLARPHWLRSKAVLLPVAGLVAVLLVLAWRFGHIKPLHTTFPWQPAVSAATASSPQESVGAPAQVRLRANAQPVGAAWYLDDRPLGPAPVDASLPRDDAPHILRAEAEGYTPLTRAIRLEADLDVTVVLVRKPSEAPQSMASGAPPTMVRKATHARAVSSRSGEPPSPLPVAAAESPSPALTPSATVRSRRDKDKDKDKDTPPLQFGDTLKRGGTGADRERHSIDDDYPGGG